MNHCHLSRLIIAIFIVLASPLYASAALAQTQEQAEQFPKNLPQGDFSAMRSTDTTTVLEVLSPLTMKLANGDVVRLSGVHFPDYTAETAGPFALTALKILKDMLEGQTVLVYQTKNKDIGRTNRMGQSLAHIVRQSDKAWVQGTMVLLGLAYVNTSQYTPEMAAQLYALEEQARIAKAGLWDEDGIIKTPLNVGERLNGFQIVEGKIESAALKKNRVYLNFGGNWRDDFTVSIPPEDRRVFSKAGINPLEWNGRRVRVRGWVEDYNGPLIEIDHPEAIELLDGQDNSHTAN